MSALLADLVNSPTPQQMRSCRDVTRLLWRYSSQSVNHLGVLGHLYQTKATHRRSMLPGCLRILM